MDDYFTDTINNSVATVLEGKYPHKTILLFAKLETYEDTPIFIPVHITEEAVKLITRKLSGNSGPGGTNSEALQRWLVKFREDSTRLCNSVEACIDLLDNGSLPWAAYRAFMSSRLIMLYKQPDVCPVGVGNTCRRLFTKIVLKVTGPEETMAYQDDQMCDGLKTGINGAFHRFQSIWDEKSTTKD